MSDEMLDWIEDHRKWIIIGIIVVILVIVCLVIRGVNAKKAEEKAQADQLALEQEQLALQEELARQELAQDTPEPEQPVGDYTYELGLRGDKGDGRVEPKETEEPEPVETPEPVKTPKYPVAVKIFDSGFVPDKNVDGSSCKDYLSKVSLADFDTYWGAALTEDDFTGAERYLVGVEKFRDKEDYDRGDLQSVGWLISHLSELNQNDCIKFVSLHVIGHLSDSHVAMLCSYDWYSAFGLKETLVVFEDISGTLNIDDFSEGDVFSATVFVHNITVKKVNGQSVVCVEYALYE